MEYKSNFEPGKDYKLFGKQEGEHGIIYNPLNAWHVQCEKISGENWDSFIYLEWQDGKAVLQKARIKKNQEEIHKGQIYVGSPIMVEPGEVNEDFINKAWEALKDNNSPKILSLKKKLKKI